MIDGYFMRGVTSKAASSSLYMAIKSSIRVEQSTENQANLIDLFFILLNLSADNLSQSSDKLKSWFLS